MALLLNAEHAFGLEDLESTAKIVKFAIVPTKQEEPDQSPKEGLMSFEAAMLPHPDAAHNLARWLLRNDQDAQDVLQQAYLRSVKPYGGCNGRNHRA